MFNSDEMHKINAMIADPDFEKLKVWNQSTSVFDMVSLRETDHSNMIKWLLDPRESHGLGSHALNALLNAAWQAANEQEILPEVFSLDIEFSPLVFNQWNLDDVVIFTEFDADRFGRIDLLLAIPDEDLVVVIENKFGAAETSGQLKRYREWGDKNLDGMHVLYIYLDYQDKWQGDADEQWVKLGYYWLMNTLSYACDQNDKNNRVHQMMLDYFMYISGDYLTHDSYFNNVKEILSLFSSRHRDAIVSIKEPDLDLFNTKHYLSGLMECWNDELRLRQWALKNKSVIELLMESNRFDSLEERIISYRPEVQIDHSDKYFWLHHDQWLKLKRNGERWWVVYLNLAERDVSGRQGLSLKLEFNFTTVKVEMIELVKNIYDEFSNTPLDVNSLGNRKSLWLERELEDDEASLAYLLKDYIDRINRLLV